MPKEDAIDLGGIVDGLEKAGVDTNAVKGTLLQVFKLVQSLLRPVQ